MNTNIYKVARNIAGMTLEEASVLLFISSNIINEYETFKKIPNENIVNNMVVVYKTPWLAYLHFMITQGMEGVEEIISIIIDDDIKDEA